MIQKLYTTINEFKQSLNEDVFNTEKETKLDNHEQIVQYYNANKDKFKNIFSQPEEKWEEEANKIIDGNVYLSHKWRIDKIENHITKLEDKLRSAEISDEEKKSIEEQISENENKLQDQSKELDKKIRQDLNEIESL